MRALRLRSLALPPTVLPPAGAHATHAFCWCGRPQTALYAGAAY